MFKLIFLAILSTVVAEDGNGKLYSLHAPENTPGALNLTTGELKLFSGHAMNIIKSKCPSVDSGKIFQITKYIGKLIAKSEPIPGTSKDFKNLLQTMTTCEKEGPKPAGHEEGSSVFRTFFYPFRRMKTIWLNHPKPDQDESSAPAGIDSGLLKPETKAKAPKVVVSSSTQAPDNTPKVIKTTIFVRPADMQEGIRTSGGFFNWIHNIFSRIGGFFGNFLPFGMIRKRRDVSGSGSILDLPDGQSPVEDIPLREMKSDFEVYTPTKEESKGKRSFGKLIDQMCRLYCDTCTGEKEIMDFKRAAKELLTFLFNEDSGIEVAAKKFLDQEFLRSIESC